MKMPTRVVYPQPGTHTERVLNHVQSNPGVTKNGIIEALGLNPATVRDIMKTLIRRGFVEDKPDTEGHHHYSAKSPVL